MCTWLAGLQNFFKICLVSLLRQGFLGTHCVAPKTALNVSSFCLRLFSAEVAGACLPPTSDLSPQLLKSKKHLYCAFVLEK